MHGYMSPLISMSLFFSVFCRILHSIPSHHPLLATSYVAWWPAQVATGQSITTRTTLALLFSSLRSTPSRLVPHAGPSLPAGNSVIGPVQLVQLRSSFRVRVVSWPVPSIHFPPSPRRPRALSRRDESPPIICSETHCGRPPSSCDAVPGFV